MITQEDTIFVAGMDPSTTEQDIETHFGAIGIIKVSRQRNIIRQHDSNMAVFDQLID